MRIILALFLALIPGFPGCALGGISAVVMSAPVSVTATTTSTKVLDANAYRNYLIIQNTGSVSVIVKFGAAQTASEGVTIPAGGNYEPFKAPVDSVYLESASSTAAVTLIEGN